MLQVLPGHSTGFRSGRMAAGSPLARSARVGSKNSLTAARRWIGDRSRSPAAADYVANQMLDELDGMQAVERFLTHQNVDPTGRGDGAITER